MSLNGSAKAMANGVNGQVHHTSDTGARAHPQVSYDQTVVDKDSFFGKIRAIYGSSVLKTQLEQLKKQGSYDAFDMKWQEIYDVRRLQGAKFRRDGMPPSLFWASDIGKWIEAVSYFLSSGSEVSTTLRSTFETAVDDLIDKIEKAQAKDGYLDIYFTVVDPEGRFKNLRDMHEMYNCGHLLEGALAHYHRTGSRRFLDCIIRYVNLMMDTFGPKPNQLHGYPGHPELELAVSRLYQVTKDPRHLAFATYLLEARGTKVPDLNDESYYVWEAKQRGANDGVPGFMNKLSDLWYYQAHEPLHDQHTILGHSVRAFYLLTAAADIGGPFLDDAKRLLRDATSRKMYATGGFGTEPQWEGFSPIPYRLPQSTDEGGCYQETCASIACMMTCERILSHEPDGRTRDIMELCLLNAVMGGGSLDGQRFAYENKLATCGDETALRDEWFEVCCCPPNLSRTIGMIGGYTWAAKVDSGRKTIRLNVWLYISAERTIPLGNGQQAVVKMTTSMPWQGQAGLDFNAPEGWRWEVLLPYPEYAKNLHSSIRPSEILSGLAKFNLPAVASLEQTFDLPVRLLSSHPRTGQDTLVVSRGPIVYTAESIDNVGLDEQFPHFRGLGIAETEQFDDIPMTISGIDMIALKSKGPVHILRDHDREELYRPVQKREWKQLDQPLQFIPWFARTNRGGKGHLRTSFQRVPLSEMV